MKGVRAMKKIPTLFERVYENHKVVDILPKVTLGMEWVLEGQGTATVKVDGSCCAIINGEFYKRYDAKKGRKVPVGAIKCQDDADPVTGHLPCWIKCDRNNPSDKWFWVAYDQSPYVWEEDGTYEAVGRHFRSNSYNMNNDILIKHGIDTIEVIRTFDGIKKYLEKNYIEGIVFWKDGEPKCKIKRSDFGFDWQ